MTPSFTSSLQSIRAGEPIKLSEDQLAALFEKVVPQVLRTLKRLFPGGSWFAADLGEDLASEMFDWLLSAIRVEGSIPPEVVSRDSIQDTRTLVFFLCDKACKRAYDRGMVRRHSTTGRPRLGGGSQLADATDELDPRVFSTIPDAARRGGPTFDDVDAELLVQDVIDNAMEDMRVWHGSAESAELAFAVLLRNTDLSMEQVADRIGLSVAQAYRYRAQVAFCVARRLGCTTHALNDKYGPDATRWESELQALGRHLGVSPDASK